MSDGANAIVMLLGRAKTPAGQPMLRMEIGNSVLDTPGSTKIAAIIPRSDKGGTWYDLLAETAEPIGSVHESEVGMVIYGAALPPVEETEEQPDEDT